MQDEVYATQLKEEHVDSATRCIVKSFLALNSIWKKHNLKYEEVFAIIRGKVMPGVIDGTCLVLIKNEKVIGVSLQYDLLAYLQAPSMPSNISLFKDLAEAGKKLEEQINVAGFNRREAIYGLYGVIDPDEAKNKYSLKFWWQSFAVGYCAGWKDYYSRISSPVSLKMLKQLGAEVLAEVTVKNTDGKEKMWMIRLPFKNLPPYQMMEAASSIKKGQKAKL